jgi:hypothetical protein
MAVDATSAVHVNSPLLHTSDDLQADFGGDVSASVAAMMLQHASESRDLTRQARAAEEKNLEAQESAEVQAMHVQADDIRAAGRWEGLTTIGAGAITCVAGVVTATGAALGSGELKHGPAGAVDALKGSGKLAEGFGEWQGAEAQGDGKVAESDGVAAGNRAEAAKRRLEDLRDEEKDANDLAHTAIDFYRDQTRTKADTDSATLSFRG